ncbi:MAG: hypothetical protein AAGI90_04390 [Chlamydiota bacterium]
MSMTTRPIDTNEPIYISGAGIGGCALAIRLARQGFNNIHLLEAREKNDKGRQNPIRLAQSSLRWMEKIGVYDALLQQKKIAPILKEQRLQDCYISISDLERAFREHIEKNHPRCAIDYGRSITAISEKDQSITVANRKGETRTLPFPKILVNAEGANSHLTTLLHLRRIPYMPKAPLCYAIYDRSPLQGFSRVGVATFRFFRTIYYLLIYLGYYLFQNEGLKNPKRILRSGLIANLPRAQFLGFALNKEKSAHLKKLIQASQAAKQRYNKQRSKRLATAYHQADKRVRNFFEYWGELSRARINVVACISWIFGMENFGFFECSLAKPLQGYQYFECTSDRLEKPIHEVGSMSVIALGDALQTVDPATGGGANFAIEQGEKVVHFLQNRSSKNYYISRIEEEMYFAQESGKVLREHYRSDLIEISRVFL